jgi:tetratricopeptide (TPR) repeat protein
LLAVSLRFARIDVMKLKISPLSLSFLLSGWLALLVAVAPARPVQQSAQQNSNQSAQQNPSPAQNLNPAPDLAAAQDLILAGKSDAAIEKLKAISRTGADLSQVNHLLGLAYYQKGDYAQAIEFFSSSIKQSKEGSAQHRQSVQLMGMSHYFLNHHKEALPFLEQAVSGSGANPEMLYVLGACYAQNQQSDKSRETFARMFSVAPASASAYLFNAQMMTRLQLESLAEKELQKALELDPKLPQANFLLAEMAIYRADIDLGIKLLQKEIEINPAFAMAYYRLGEALTRQVKWDEAIAPLQKSIWLNPYFSGPFIVLGKVYLKKGDLANAESSLRRALKMDPNNYSGHHILAQVLQQASRPEEAKREFEIADRLRAEAEK